jgi:heme-degrading monooxygenase HmoA
MILRLSYVFVPRLSEVSLEELRAWTVNNYTAAPGLYSVLLFQRQLAGYVEVVTLSIWQAEEAMTRFFSDKQHSEWNHSEKGAIRKESQSYELVVAVRGSLPDADGDPYPDLREGAD